MTIRSARRAATALVAFLGAVAVAQAAQDTGTLTVTATVKSNCDVTGGTLAFGEYVSGQTAAADGVGSVSISNCPNASVRLELNGGSSGSVTDRRMAAGGGATLRYQLFRDQGRSQAWAAGADALDITLGAAATQNVPVYGRVIGGQAVAPGNYTDNVTVTMTF